MPLTISYSFDGSELSDYGAERDPSIMWWTSADPLWSESIPVEWTNKKERLFSVEHTVTIPIEDNAKLREDDTIRMECIVMAPNQDGLFARSKAGSSWIYLNQLIPYLKKAKNNEMMVELRLQTYQPNEEPFLKGRLTLKLKDQSKLKNISWAFKGSDFSLVMSNSNLFGAVINYGALRNMCPFDERTQSDGLHFSPIDNTVKYVHAPVWINEGAPLMGNFYWVQYTPYIHDEAFYANLANIALSRRQMTREQVIGIVDRQFKSDADAISHEFFDVLCLMSDMFTIVSTSLPYIGDFTNTGKRGKHAKGEQVSIESFHDALRMLGGDCEDLAQLIHRVASGLEEGNPALANKGVHFSKRGGWKDPLLQSMQRVCHIYVPMGSLGSVVGAYLGQKEKNKSPYPPIIYSKEDYDIELGAHMWWEWIPLAKVEKLMQSANKSRPFRLYPDEKQYKWENSMAHFVGEGTGYMDPLLRPISDYFNHDPVEQKKRVEKYSNILSVFGHIAKNSEKLCKAQYQRIQSMLTYQPDIRLTKFYRETTHCYTDKFYREGYNFSEFSWVHLSPRVNESDGKIQAPQNGWVWGVSMRDKLYDKQNVGLVVSPGYTDIELHVTKTVLRQLPPLAQLRVESSVDVVSSMKAMGKEFQNDLDSITKGRKSDSKITIVNAIFKRADFETTETRTLVLNDVRKIKEIVKAELFCETVTSEIHNYRIALQYQVPKAEAAPIHSTIGTFNPIQDSIGQVSQVKKAMQTKPNVVIEWKPMLEFSKVEVKEEKKTFDDFVQMDSYLRGLRDAEKSKKRKEENEYYSEAYDKADEMREIGIFPRIVFTSTDDQ